MALKKTFGNAVTKEETDSPSMATMKKLGEKKAPLPAAAEDALAESTPDEGVPMEAAKPAKEKVKKAKVVAPQKLADVSNDLFISTKMSLEDLTEDNAINRAHELIDETGLNDFQLGGILSAIQMNGWWEGKGFENFKGFVESEFGLAYRKSMYLITIYNYLTESGVPYESVKHLGWTKLREIAGVMTLENMDEWVERAGEMTVVQICEYIKASATAVDPDDDSPVMTSATALTAITFKVHDDQKEIIKEAVEKAKITFATEFDSVALENIAMTFIEGSTGKKSEKTIVAQLASLGLEGAIAVFEEAFPGASLSLELPADDL